MSEPAPPPPPRRRNPLASGARGGLIGFTGCLVFLVLGIVLVVVILVVVGSQLGGDGAKAPPAAEPVAVAQPPIVDEPAPESDPLPPVEPAPAPAPPPTPPPRNCVAVSLYEAVVLEVTGGPRDACWTLVERADAGELPGAPLADAAKGPDDPLDLSGLVRVCRVRSGGLSIVVHDAPPGALGERMCAALRG